MAAPASRDGLYTRLPLVAAETPIIGSVHRVPRGTRVVERADRLVELARGQRVIDLGFVDEGRMALRRQDGTWLHDRLGAVAREIVGIDLNTDGVEEARGLGIEAYAADCTDPEALRSLRLAPADLVIAGELIEHIDVPGAFLDAVKVLLADGGRLVLTTPNGLSLTNFLAGLLHRELVNIDHVAWYSRQTLQTLLERHGWRLDEVTYYFFPKPEVAETRARRAGPVATAIFRAYTHAYHPLLRVRPGLADGLLVVASRA
jgi:SAM-dependent methyltransferase